MIVECPNCQTKFNLPDEKVGPDGAKVRCGVCKTVFSVEPPEPDDFPGFGESGAKPIWATAEDDEPPGREAEPERMRDRFEDVRPSTADFDDLGFAKPEKAGLSKLSSLSKLSKILMLAGLLVVMLGGAYGTGAYFFEFWPFSKKAVKSAMEEPIPAAVQQAPQPQTPAPAMPSMEDRLQNLPIVEYTQYLVDNPKIGKLYVIEGAVENKNATDVGWVKVKASLANDKGEVILSKEIDAGPKVPNYELKFLSKNDLDARLSSKQEILFNNGDVKPGEKIPFMVVFENIPPETKEYSLQVTSFQDVAPPATQGGQQPAAATPAQHPEGK